MTERGSLTIEAALVIPVLLVVGLAIFEGLAAVSVQLQVVAATRDGVRIAATVPDVARAAATTRSLLPDVVAAGARVFVDRPATAGEPARVRVEAWMPLRTPVLDGLRIPLAWTSSMLVEP